jgi:glutamate--cysteine ligase
VSREQEQSSEPLLGAHQLIDHLRDGSKLAGARGVGTEHEKFGVWADSFAPVTYDGPRGLEALFERLVERFGWSAEYDRGRPMALLKAGRGALTLEPGGQFELSGAITRTIHETAVELDAHLDEVRVLSEELGIHWLGAGCQPFTPAADMPLIPKSRYAFMAPFLEARGTMARGMMRGTSTVQANLDYRDEADCAEMVALSARLSPFVSALFANSSVVGGADSGYASYRCHIWTDTDPARCGTPAFFLDGTFSFARYVDWVLDVPTMFIRRDGGYVDLGGLPFRAFMSDGFEGHRATLGDWELHLSTAFPDIRVKRYIEVRGADGGGRDAILGLPALWKGLLYDDDARAAATALVGDLGVDDHRALYDAVCLHGLDAEWGHRPIRPIVAGLLEAASAGLDRQAGAARHASEAVYLEPLSTWLEPGASPAQRALRVWSESGGDRAALAEHLRLA